MPRTISGRRDRRRVSTMVFVLPRIPAAGSTSPRLAPGAVAAHHSAGMRMTSEPTEDTHGRIGDDRTVRERAGNAQGGNGCGQFEAQRVRSAFGPDLERAAR